MEQKEESIHSALVKVRSKIKDLKKDATANIPTKSGNSFSYSYASLPQILEAINPHLESNNILLTQGTTVTDGTTYVFSTLYHTPSEKQIYSELPIEWDSPQDLGSALTYFRRYMLTAQLGICPDEDDDGASSKSSHRKSGGNSKTTYPKHVKDVPTYTFNWGKYSGQKISDINPTDLLGYVEFLLKKAEKKNDIDFFTMVKEYLVDSAQSEQEWP